MTNHWSDSLQRNIISSMSEVNEQYLIENWNKNFPKKNCTSYLVINSLCTEEVVITTIYYYQLKHYNFLVNSNLQTLMYFIYILRHLPPIKQYYLHTLCKSQCIICSLPTPVIITLVSVNNVESSGVKEKKSRIPVVKIYTFHSYHTKLGKLCNLSPYSYMFISLLT